MQKFDFRNIEIDPFRCGGQPVVAGTRIRVAVVLSCYRQGMSVEELVQQYPCLKPSDVHDALAYAYEHQDQIDFDLQEDDEATVKQWLADNTPSNAELRRLAAASPPPSAWFEADEERPW